MSLPGSPVRRTPNGVGEVGCYTYDVDPRWVRVTFVGPLSVECVVESRAAVMADPGFVPGTSLLIDMREAQTSTLTVQHLHMLVSDGKRRTSEWPPFRMAVVVGRTVDFGVARQYATYGDRPNMTLRVFQNADTAEAWLAEIGPRTTEAPLTTGSG